MEIQFTGHKGEWVVRAQPTNLMIGSVVKGATAWTAINLLGQRKSGFGNRDLAATFLLNSIKFG